LITKVSLVNEDGLQLRFESFKNGDAYVIGDELQSARHINLTFLVVNNVLLIGLGGRTVATAVLNDLFSCAKETRMSMKVNFAIALLVPLCVQKQILGVQQTVDLHCLVFWGHKEQSWCDKKSFPPAQPTQQSHL
jgi:hypothetical protein